LIQPRRYGINSLQFRLDIAKQLLENAFPEHFLVGFGLGSSEHVAARYTKYMLLPHNDFLRSLIETGLIGLIGFIVFIIMNFKYYIQRVRQFPSRPYNLFMFALLSTYVVVAFAQNISVFISTAGYVFCFLGVTQKLNDLEEINNK
jgi:O-antigen ligase